MPAIGPILVVCTANICRSPMGAALLRHALAAEPEPLRSVPVISAGVSARSGEPMTNHSVVALRKVGIEDARHASKPLTQEMLNQASLVLCMTEAHRAMIEATANPPPRHLYLFRELMEPADRTEIVDPFGGPYSGYELSRDEMVEAIPSLLAFLKTQLGPARRA
jgi:protein-tyrosine phosphatase